MLEVEGLTKYYSFGMIHKRYVKAVDGVSFVIKKGETLGLVGESGCGKTTVSRLILRLVKPTGGKVLFDDVDLFALKREKLRKIRSRMQMIFQDPESSLNPRIKIKDSLIEPLKLRKLPKKEIEQMIPELMEIVELLPEHLNRYPYQLSGGQNQRVILARIIAVNPDFIIADEPTSALDVSVQAQILNMMKDMQKKYDQTYLFISHDLDVVKIIADSVGFMYLGRILEIGKVADIFSNPKHPYAQGLLSAFEATSGLTIKEKSDLIILKGDTPNPIDIPTGCRFHTRCPYMEERCKVEEPEMVEVEEGHFVACHFFNSISSII
ncbi:peptide/nickel transport system ATP-binding protein [Candidatus Methanomarinus sp.]|nr:peptide/nickel transport system ATP-binding protein [ANME-2 cluster archaeon]